MRINKTFYLQLNNNFLEGELKIMSKKLLKVFAILMLCFGFAPVQTHAHEHHEYATQYVANESVDLRAPIYYCPKCNGSLRKVTEPTGEWIKTGSVACSHGKSGKDSNYKRPIKITSSCASCGYKYSSTSYEYKTDCEGI